MKFKNIAVGALLALSSLTIIAGPASAGAQWRSVGVHGQKWDTTHITKGDVNTIRGAQWRSGRTWGP